MMRKALAVLWFAAFALAWPIAAVITTCPDRCSMTVRFAHVDQRMIDSEWHHQLQEWQGGKSDRLPDNHQ